MNVSIVKNQETGQTTVSAFVPGRGLVQADDTHPSFSKILDEALKHLAAGKLGPVLSGDAFADLFDLAATLETKFRSLSDRLTFRNGRVYFDGDEENSVLTEHMLRSLEEGNENWKALVLFRENLAANPDPHSRENAYRWFASHDFTILEDGCVLGYKGLRDDFTSLHAAPAAKPVMVNNVPTTGRIPNAPGSVIHMARSNVQHAPEVGCSEGLHIGTYGYARDFGSVVVEVKFNPRDIVSVPTDCNDAKLRACRYEVLRECKGQTTKAVSPVYNVNYHNVRGPDGRFVKAA